MTDSFSASKKLAGDVLDGMHVSPGDISYVRGRCPAILMYLLFEYNNTIDHTY